MNGACEMLPVTLALGNGFYKYVIHTHSYELCTK